MTWEDHSGELVLAVGLYLIIRCAEAMVPKAFRTRLNARIVRRPAVARSSGVDRGRPEGGALAIRRP